jgi:hypothetical protein
MQKSFWQAGALALGVLLAVGPGRVPDALAQSSVGSAEFRDIAFDGAFGTGTIGRVSFTGLVQQGDVARAQTIRVERLSWKLSEFSLDIPTIRFENFEGPRAFVDMLTSGRGSGVDWIAVINRTRVSQIAVDRISQKVGGQAAASGTLTDLVFEALGDGKLATLRFANWEFEGATPQQENVRWRLGASRYDDLNLAEFGRYVTGGGSGPAKLLIGSAVGENIETSSSDGTRMRIARSDSRGTYGRGPREGLTRADIEAIDTIKNNGNPALARKLANFARDVIANMRVEEASLTGWEIETPGGPAKIDSMRMANYGLAGFEKFELLGLEIEPPTGSVRIDRIAMENFDYTPLIDFLLGALERGEAPEQNFEKIRDAMPSMGAFRIENVSADTPEGPVTLGSFAIESERAGAVLSAVTTSLKQLRIRLDEGTPSEAKEKLVALGYPEIIADAQVVLRYDSATKAFLIERTGATIERAGGVEATLRVEDVDIDEMLKAGEAAAALAMQARLGSLDIKLNDLGFAERFYESVAQDSGVAPDAIRDGLAAQLRVQANAIFGAALTPGSADQVAQFMRDPGALTIRVLPRPDRPPLLVGDLQEMAPPQLADRLTVTIEAKGK